MTTPAFKRLMVDVRSLQSHPQPGITVEFDEKEEMVLIAEVCGLANSLFSGGRFKLKMNFCKEYPFKPPRVKFITKIFHPNVYAQVEGHTDRMSDGKICLDILGSKWLSCLNVTAILFSIQQLLDEPNPLDPANNVAALMFTENPQEYQKRVKICVDRTKVLPPLRPRQTRYLLRSSRIKDSR